jgi:hypothetical protein
MSMRDADVDDTGPDAWRKAVGGDRWRLDLGD